MSEPKLREKRWTVEFEEELLREWTQDYLHPFNPDSGKPIFVIDTPPPYPSGEWHIGAVAGYSLIDMIARMQRMMGYEVLFPFCLDKNGINIELTVERKYGKSLHEFDREEFIGMCREEIGKIADGILTLARRIGISADFEKSFYETDSAEYRSLTQSIFIDLFKRGLVYRGMRPSFFCPVCGTTIAEAEIEYVEKPSKLIYLLFEVKETGEQLEIATTRPELLCACKAVIVHPSDERYQHLQNKTAIVPMYDIEVRIYPHHYAKPEFGTGVAMMCSYGDQADVQLFRELNLEAVSAINTDGRMTDAAGKYAGMAIEEAREAIVEDLKEQGYVTREESVLHKTPMCSRSRTPVEFISMEEWYLKQIDFLEDLKKLTNEMEFHPPRTKQFLDSWFDALTIDWPISRRRYYHTEIPLWYCKTCNEVLVPKPGKYYRPWKEKAPFDYCPNCGGRDFRGEDRVFDTWMDSSNTNLVVTRYMKDTKFFEENFPCSLRPQGRDIVRTWLYYTLLKSYLVTGKKPFEHVFIHGMGLDEHGRAMHRTLGNIIHPGPVIEKNGADAFRYWAAAGTTPGDDFRISEPRIAGAKKFLTKFWNVARFISSFPQAEKGELKPTDEWILAEVNDLVKECRQAYSEFNLFIPANRVREFLWNVFAPHYVEMVKGRAYQGDASCMYALHESLRIMLRLLAPITPFITEKIWREIYGGSIHQTEMPVFTKERKSELSVLTQKLIEFNSMVWKEKKEKGVSLKSDISGIELPKDLMPFQKDLVRMHNLT